jgi:hypothetical protein
MAVQATLALNDVAPGHLTGLELARRTAYLSNHDLRVVFGNGRTLQAPADDAHVPTIAEIAALHGWQVRAARHAWAAPGHALLPDTAALERPSAEALEALARHVDRVEDYLRLRTCTMARPETNLHLGHELERLVGCHLCDAAALDEVLVGTVLDGPGGRTVEFDVLARLRHRVLAVTSTLMTVDADVERRQHAIRGRAEDVFGSDARATAIALHPSSTNGRLRRRESKGPRTGTGRRLVVPIDAARRRQAGSARTPVQMRVFGMDEVRALLAAVERGDGKSRFCSWALRELKPTRRARRPAHEAA